MTAAEYGSLRFAGTTKDCLFPHPKDCRGAPRREGRRPAGTHLRGAWNPDPDPP